jgi:uncharacterized protein (DUF2384 family)
MKAPEISEKDILIDKLFKQGTAQYGSQEKFSKWMHSKNAVMNDDMPASNLDTFSGIQLVFDELNAIEHGFSA